jgi:hypothetical protein
MEKRQEIPAESEPLEQSLMTTLKESKLGQIIETIAEVPIDFILEEGFLREIPIVSTLVGMIRVGAAYRDRLLLKKLLLFLRELADVELTERDRMIRRLEQDSKMRIRVGENPAIPAEGLSVSGFWAVWPSAVLYVRSARHHSESDSAFLRA